MYEIKIVRSVLNDGQQEFKVTSCKDVVNYIESFCMPKEDQWREQAWVLAVNGGNRITGHFLLSVGGTNSTTFDKKVVAKFALDYLAEAVILVHNHPSGNPTPSRKDIEETLNLRNALRVFDIKLLDHIIIGDGSYYSFSSEKTESIDNA